MQVLRIIMFGFATFALLGSASLAARKPAAKKSAPSKTTATKSRSKAAPRHTASAAKSKSKAGQTASRSGRSTKSRRPVVARRRAVQSAPSAERYQEIQQALARRGFFQGEPNGTWGPDSIDALKRFQQEQKLAPSGKLDSVTLIALGLGPRRNLASGAGPDLNTLPRPQDENRRSQGSERP